MSWKCNIDPNTNDRTFGICIGTILRRIYCRREMVLANNLEERSLYSHQRSEYPG